MNSGRLLVDARLPWGSGIGRYVSNIVPQVAARLPSAAITLLVSDADRDRASAIMGIHANLAVRVSDVRPFSLAEQLALPRLARDHDVTWFTNYWVPLRWPGRFVATVHDVMHLDRSFPASRAKRIAAARTFAGIRRNAAHILFVSRFTAREFERIVGRPAASTVIHHGIDHEGALLTGSDGPRERFALAVAAAKEHKNLAMLIDAWRRAAIAGWRLVLVTPGDRLRSSIDLEALVGASDIEIRRDVDHHALSRLYARAGFVVVPSRYEGFGLPLLEAMRAGAPVVSSTADALVEIAAGAVIPFVVPEDRDGWVEALKRAADAHERRTGHQAAIDASNQAYARTFTWDRAGFGTAAVLARELGERVVQ